MDGTQFPQLLTRARYGQIGEVGLHIDAPGRCTVVWVMPFPQRLGQAVQVHAAYSFTISQQQPQQRETFVIYRHLQRKSRECCVKASDRGDAVSCAGSAVRSPAQQHLQHGGIRMKLNLQGLTMSESVWGAGGPRLWRCSSVTRWCCNGARLTG